MSNKKIDTENNTYMGEEINRDFVMNMVTEFENNPRVDIISGKVDSAWVNLAKLKVETVMKLYNLDKNKL